MTITNFRAVGGTMNMTVLKRGLSEKEYDVYKAYLWFEMLKDGKRPEKWYTPTKKGTSVKFAVMQSQLEADTALGELKGYMNGINKKYPGLDLEIEDDETTLQAIFERGEF